jgi:hypothetical protein
MRYAAGALLLALTSASLLAQPELSSLKGNVARIDAGSRTGFGFIVGLADYDLLIATAWHTLQDLTSDTVTVCFPQRDELCGPGIVAYVADAIGSQPAIDLAIVRTPYPAGLVWRPDALGGRPRLGDPVWFIGRSREWYVPREPGRVTAFDAAKQLLSYTGLEVAEGVSGAPILSPNGIVAMHVESVGAGGEARGVDVQAIHHRVVEGLRARWLLVPRGQCDKQSPHALVLAGRNIVVHLDRAQPEAGLHAIAQLNCLGATALPRPIGSNESWPGNRITYASGELRLARTVQSLLTSLARMDTRLGNAEGGLEIWVR